MKNNDNLFKKLNLNYLLYTNKTYSIGKLGLPAIKCNIDLNIDYIALYSQPNDYFKTANTCVSFYDYDNKFNGQFGLYNSIYYDNTKLLKRFKERFRDIKIFIMPDITLAGDIQPLENHHRMFEQRIISLWLTIICDAIVIPNVGVSCREDFEYMLDGLEDVSVMAVSTKGKINNIKNRELLIDTINYIVDNNKKLRRFIVYDVCKDNYNILKIFKYAISNNIEIVIPNNALKTRNEYLAKKRRQNEWNR